MLMRKHALIGAIAGLAFIAGTTGALADDQISAAGNGGTATSAANGGAAALGDVDSGDNIGSVIGVGDTSGDVVVSGGAIANSTGVNVELTGGTAIAAAPGGDGE